MQFIGKPLAIPAMTMRNKLSFLFLSAAIFLSAQTSQAAFNECPGILAIIESVPDAGATVALLGAGLAAIALLRRKTR